MAAPAGGTRATSKPLILKFMTEDRPRRHALCIKTPSGAWSAADECLPHPPGLMRIARMGAPPQASCNWESQAQEAFSPVKCLTPIACDDVVSLAPVLL